LICELSLGIESGTIVLKQQQMYEKKQMHVTQTKKQCVISMTKGHKNEKTIVHEAWRDLGSFLAEKIFVIGVVVDDDGGWPRRYFFLVAFGVSAIDLYCCCCSY
jgi:hypothetical protein